MIIVYGSLQLAPGLLVITERTKLTFDSMRSVVVLQELVKRHQLDHYYIPMPPPDLLRIEEEDLIPRLPMAEVPPAAVRRLLAPPHPQQRHRPASTCARCAGTGTVDVDAGGRRVPAHRCPSCRVRSR